MFTNWDKIKSVVIDAGASWASSSIHAEARTPFSISSFTVDFDWVAEVDSKERWWWWWALEIASNIIPESLNRGMALLTHWSIDGNSGSGG